jgi:transposase
VTTFYTYPEPTPTIAPLNPAIQMPFSMTLTRFGSWRRSTTCQVGAWIEKECGIAYESRSGLIALLHRLGMEHRKPQAVSRKLDPDKQAVFIKELRKSAEPHWR